MNFLSSALSLISTSSIPYTIKEKVVDPRSALFPQCRSVWTIYNGINPKNEALVSIFEFSLKDPVSYNNTKLAYNSFRKLKSIKFPGVLSVVDFIENESFLYIITERITPLAKYLDEYGDRVSEDAKILGIYNLVQTLILINTKANCLHGKLDLSSSIYVNAHGEWKLFGFELLTNLNSDPDQPIYRLSGKSSGFDENMPPEVIENGVESIRKFPLKFDAFKLGVIINALFSAKNFSSPYTLKFSNNSTGPLSVVDRGKLPREMQASVSKLLVHQSKRIDVQQFASELEIFFDSSRLVKFSHLLEGVKFEDESSKLTFFKTEIAEYIEGDLPPGFLDHKVLPEIVQQYKIVMNQKPTVNTSPEDRASRQETTSVLLNHILKLSNGLSDEMFSKTIKPIIFAAFSLSDRAIRLMLLKYLSDFHIRLTDTEVQTKVFNNLLTGLQDTNFLIRETTLTSITSIIEKVSVKQVNRELLKILAKSQMDPKPSIRTNTLILIISIANKIYSTSRNSVMITALAKALRDSFTPCKLAALSGFEKLLDTFSLEEICSKVLGHLAIALMDPKSFKVRQESKRIFDLYLESVERHAATLPNNEEDEDAEEKHFYQNSTECQVDARTEEIVTSAPRSSLSIGWSVVNRLVASDPSNVEGSLNKAINTSTPELTRASSPQARISEWDQASDYEGGWDDDAAGFDDNPPKVSKVKLEAPALSLSAKAKVKQRHGTNLPTNSAEKSEKIPDTKIPGSTLKLDLDVDAEEDTWGDEW